MYLEIKIEEPCIDNLCDYVSGRERWNAVTTTLFVITIQSGTDNVFSRSIIRCV